jgi:hypothetical protein
MNALLDANGIPLLDANGMPNTYSEATQDPTAAAVRRPWSPMTPEQLDSYRPKAAAAVPETPEQEARRISYQTGITELAPLVLRLIALEKEVAELRAAK